MHTRKQSAHKDCFSFSKVIYSGLYKLSYDNHSGQTPIWRKAMWMVIIVGGVIYSAYNIGKFTDRKRILKRNVLKYVLKIGQHSSGRYLSYPSTIKPEKNYKGDVRFPKINVCLNVKKNLKIRKFKCSKLT